MNTGIGTVGHCLDTDGMCLVAAKEMLAVGVLHSPLMMQRVEHRAASGPCHRPVWLGTTGRSSALFLRCVEVFAKIH